MKDLIEMKNDTPRPKPTVLVIGTVDAKSEQIHRERAQTVADFFGMSIVLEDKGNREEMTFISGDKSIVLVAHGGIDGGFFSVKDVKESR